MSNRRPQEARRPWAWLIFDVRPGMRRFIVAIVAVAALGTAGWIFFAVGDDWRTLVGIALLIAYCFAFGYYSLAWEQRVAEEEAKREEGHWRKEIEENRVRHVKIFVA